MNICLFTDSFLPKVGGMELAVHHLANALCARGDQVSVIAKYVKGPFQFKKQYQLFRYGNRFPLSGSTGLDTWAAIRALRQAHHRQHFDLIHCHGASYAAYRIYLAKKYGLLRIPHIITPHGGDIQVVPELGYGIRLQKKWDRIVIRNLQTADGLTAISTTILNHMKIVDPRKVQLIPNGIHPSEFKCSSNSYLQKRLGLAYDDKIVLSVGRHREVKGYEFGIRAFAILRETRKTQGLKYIIIGKDTNVLLPLVKSLNLSASVFILPQMKPKEIAEAYASAWCFLSPSLSEGLSLVSIEAMAGGLPLIVTNVPGNADVVQNNEVGLIVAPGQPQAIADALLYLLNRPDLHEKFHQQALTQASAYAWSNIAEQYAWFYRRIIARETDASDRIDIRASKPVNP